MGPPVEGDAVLGFDVDAIGWPNMVELKGQRSIFVEFAKPASLTFEIPIGFAENGSGFASL